VDVQNDFLPGGSLAVAGADEIVPVLNGYIRAFRTLGLPILATRDWHPRHHSSFKEEGGPWPEHCVAGSKGAEFPPELELAGFVKVFSKGRALDKDAYSGFEGTDLNKQLEAAGVRRLFIGGLATDVCVLNTIRDALNYGYEVFLLEDAIKAVEVKQGDGQKAIKEMTDGGALPVRLENLS
jgi:nicotinamidase/pyrazinamidase